MTNLQNTVADDCVTRGCAYHLEKATRIAGKPGLVNTNPTSAYHQEHHGPLRCPHEIDYYVHTA